VIIAPVIFIFNPGVRVHPSAPLGAFLTVILPAHSRAIGATDAWAVEYEQEWLISIDSTPLVTFAFHVAVFYIWFAEGR